MKKIIEKVRTLMKKIPNIFYIIFSIIFIIIFFSNIYFNNTNFTNLKLLELLWYNDLDINKLNILQLFLSTAIYILFIYLIYKIFIKYIKHKKRFVIISCILFFMIQCLFAYIFAVKPSWDFGYVYNALQNDLTNKVSFFDDFYFYRYDNNLGLAVMMKCLFGIFKLFGVKNFFAIGLGFNIVMIDIAIFYLYRTIKLFMDENKSYFFLICCLLFLPFITYTPIFYTDTLSMPFVIVGVYYLLSFLIDKQRKLNLILGGIAIGLGSCIKFSVIIILVAFFVYVLFDKINIKNKIKYISILLIFCMIPILSLNIVKNIRMDSKLLEESNFPLTHWIMMGLKTDEYGVPGGYYSDDVEFTSGFYSISSKKAANKEVIKQRLKEKIKNGSLINYYIKKSVYVWGDGSFFAMNVLKREPINNYKINKIICGNASQTVIFRCISQAYMLLIILFTILAVLYRKYLENKQKNVLFLNTIIIFGVYLFFLIWEARSRYLVNYIPVLLIQTYLGVIAVFNRIKVSNKYAIDERKGV